MHWQPENIQSTESKRKWDSELAQDLSEDDSKRPCLRIATNINVKDDIQASDNDGLSDLEECVSDVDSLFDDPVELVAEHSNSGAHAAGISTKFLNPAEMRLASCSAPPIPGLFAPAVRLPPELANELLRTCMDRYFQNPNVNQVMLFGRADPTSDSSVPESGLPHFLNALVSTISELLLPELPSQTHALLFPPPGAPIRARQAILNLYHPGEGISPHVDLLKRFGDGIVGISLGSGCVMGFRRDPEYRGASVGKAPDVDEAPHDQPIIEGGEEWDLYLPERSIIVLSEDARYKWTHEIQRRTGDFIQRQDGEEGVWIERGVRLSITLRWLLPGADIVGNID